MDFSWSHARRRVLELTARPPPMRLFVVLLAVLAAVGTPVCLGSGLGTGLDRAQLLRSLDQLSDAQLLALNRTMALAVVQRRSHGAGSRQGEVTSAAARRRLLQVIDVKSHSPSYAPTQAGVFSGGDQAIPELEVRPSLPPPVRSRSAAAGPALRRLCPAHAPSPSARRVQGYMPPLGYEQMSPECTVR